jgi:hypothetical protein
MKLICLLKELIPISLFFTINLSAQQKISIDLGAVRQKNYHNGGMNLSGFYHFNEKLLGGLEINRFFPVHRTIEEEEVELSGWDVEMNIHYLLPLFKGLKFYPITGISHTSEKELDEIAHSELNENFWSVNTGAGMYFELDHFLPHVEYVFSWGHINQQFLLVGVGYELEWGHHKKNRKEKRSN